MLKKKLLYDITFPFFTAVELFQRKQKIQKPQKVLIITLAGIGNTLLALPMQRALKQHDHEVVIDWLIKGNAARELIQLQQETHKVHVWTSNWWQNVKVVFRLRKQYDTILLALPPGMAEVTIARALGPKQIVGHPFNKGFLRQSRAWITHCVPWKKTHDIISNCDLLKIFEITVQAPEFIINLPEEKEGIKPRKKQKTNFVGIHAGTNRMQPWKRWQIERFIELAHKLKRQGMEPLFFIGPGETEIEKKIPQKFNKFKESNLIITAEAIKNCSVFVGNDSALIHIAAGLGIPTVGIFGPTTHWRTRPWKQTLMRKPLWCAPCYDVQKPFKCINKNYLACLKAISVEKVLETVIKQKKEGSF